MSDRVGACTRLVLVRHGVARDAAERCIGHTDLPLASDGASGIHALCAFASSVVVGPVRVVSSDLRRAFDSSAIIAATLGVPVAVDTRLREMNFGEWDGRRWSELEQADGERLRRWTDGWLTESPPGGERLSDVRRRAAEWLRDATSATDAIDQTIIIVSHAGWIRVAITQLLGRAWDDLFEIPVDHAHATVIDCRSSHAWLVAENAGPSTQALDAS
ncbi:MAG TPA: histidine phosphatase family protein [Gemmatimonadaceae bacterium]|jgi:broad specificity phosphatase PhoE